MRAPVCIEALRKAAAGYTGGQFYEDEHRSNPDYAYRESATLEGVIGDAR
jgi:hypothetical protein